MISKGTMILVSGIVLLAGGVYICKRPISELREISRSNRLENEVQQMQARARKSD